MNICLNRTIFLKYLKMTGFILLFMFIYLVAQVIVSGTITILYSLKMGLESGGAMDLNKLETTVFKNTGFIIFISGLLALPIYLLVSVCRNESFVKASGFKKVSTRNIALSALLGAGVSTVLAMVLSFVPVESWFPDYVDTMDKLVGSGSLFAIVLGTGVMAPFIEEIIFRGLILSELEKNMPIKAAVIIQGLLFGIFHFNVLQGIYAAILGILLGFVFAWTRSIWASMVVHLFINNTSTFLSNVLGEEFSGYYIILALIAGLIATAFAVYSIRTDGKKPLDGSILILK